MATQEVTDPVVLDATLQATNVLLGQIKDKVQPVNVCFDLDYTIPSSGWSNSSPYIHTYSNNKITTECAISVSFLEGQSSANPLYLDCEKVTNGVRFTAPVKPSVDIPVRIHVINAEADSITSINADMVSTNAISGSSNVQQALGSLNSHITNLNINTISSSTSLLALFNAMSNDTVKRFYSSTGNNFTDYPSGISANNPFIIIEKRAAVGVITITSLIGSGSNDRAVGYVYGTDIYWEKLALNSQLTTKTDVTFTPAEHVTISSDAISCYKWNGFLFFNMRIQTDGSIGSTTVGTFSGVKTPNVPGYNYVSGGLYDGTPANIAVRVGSGTNPTMQIFKNASTPTSCDVWLSGTVRIIE